MKLTHLGGQDTVTGSCHLLQHKGVNILVDCGLAQGEGLMSDVRGQRSEVGRARRSLERWDRRR